MNEEIMNAEEVIDVPEEEVIDEATSEEVATEEAPSEEAPSEETGGLGFMTSTGTPIQLREEVIRWDALRSRQNLEEFYGNYQAIINNINSLRNGGSLDQVRDACNYVQNAFGIEIDYSEAEKNVSGYELAMMKMQDALAVLMCFMTGICTHSSEYYINGVSIDELMSTYIRAQESTTKNSEVSSEEEVDEEEG